jgi:hypothetical protein
VTRDEFYAEFAAFLASIKPGRDLSGLAPDTHLWAAGYLDSVGMLEVVAWLEAKLVSELELSGDFLPTFFTMARIYETHVASADAATGGAVGRAHTP